MDSTGWASWWPGCARAHVGAGLRLAQRQRSAATTIYIARLLPIFEIYQNEKDAPLRVQIGSGSARSPQVSCEGPSSTAKGTTTTRAGDSFAGSGRLRGHHLRARIEHSGVDVSPTSRS